MFESLRDISTTFCDRSKATKMVQALSKSSVVLIAPCSLLM